MSISSDQNDKTSITTKTLEYSVFIREKLRNCWWEYEFQSEVVWVPVCVFNDRQKNFSFFCLNSFDYLS